MEPLSLSAVSKFRLVIFLTLSVLILLTSICVFYKDVSFETERIQLTEPKAVCITFPMCDHVDGYSIEAKNNNGGK